MPTKPMDQRMRIRLNSSVDANGCWVWNKKTDRIGYGRLKVSLGTRENFISMSAHRYAYQLFVGPIPLGMNVLHKCDVRSCCNPEHLFLGTQAENMRDMHRKGRGPKGYKRKNTTACRENSLKRKRFANQHTATHPGNGREETC